MITITENAKKKFKELLLGQTKDPDVAVRIKSVSAGLNQLEFVFDKEKEGDHVVRDATGSKLVLVAPESAPAVDGAVIGHQKACGFIIEKLNSDIS